MKTIADLADSQPMSVAALDDCQLRAAAQTRITELCAQHGIRVPTLAFNLRGRSAGRADPRHHHIRLNPVLFRENYDAFIGITIPHELCHLWHHQLGLSGRVHGREWQRLMRRMGVDDPCRTHSYDTSRAGVRRTRRFTYQCRCRTHMITRVI
ncbi:MAG: SprT-like domain-containing protein, partial [Pyrinomonadaceae bacterium]|nr:SprT-like domain-containing protein [Pyrinomonadaceae bacterium]